MGGIEVAGDHVLHDLRIVLAVLKRIGGIRPPVGAAELQLQLPLHRHHGDLVYTEGQFEMQARLDAGIHHMTKAQAHRLRIRRHGVPSAVHG